MAIRVFPTDKEVFEDLDDYIRSQRRAIARRMACLKRIYLDTKYWLFIRDVSVGQPRSETHQLLYNKLFQLVASGAVVCPVTDNTLHEIFRQDDFRTRLATAKVMDQLSKGIALMEPIQRVRIEILHFLRTRRESTDSLHILSDWVWTSACWSLGEMYPYTPGASPETQALLQRGFCDEMAKRTIADLVTSLAPFAEPVPKDFLNNLSSMLTEGKMRHASQINSPKQAFMMEVEGLLDYFRDEIARALAYIGKAEAVSAADVDLEIDAIRELFRTGRIGTSLPYFNTQAGLHAAFRWNHAQKFKANDWIDYSHASAALPYFDLFLTENALASNVRSPALGYDLLYETQVCSEPDEALEALEAI
jgi:hypothetical protein